MLNYNKILDKIDDKGNDIGGNVGKALHFIARNALLLASTLILGTIIFLSAFIYGFFKKK